MICVFALLVGGCATTSTSTTAEDSPTVTAHATLASLQLAYEGALGAAGTAYKQGLISEEVKDKILIIGNLYWNSHQLATIALEQWVNWENQNVETDTAGQAKFQALLVDLITQSKDLIQYISNLIAQASK
jgi:hypothetical protein